MNPAPRQLAHYTILERIGRGGMGVVYRARDRRLGRLVAIKVLPASLNADAEHRSRLMREARAAAQLNHPNIATIYEVGEATLQGDDFTREDIDLDLPLTENEPLQSVLYIAMEYVEGEDLTAVLRRRSQDFDQALDIGIQIADALAAAHGAGVVHRDLKPQNVRLTPDGRIKVLDFGLAKLLRGEKAVESLPGAAGTLHTVQGMILGTVPYMAPEQLEGETIDARADLFSLGVVLYQMLAGRMPFPGKSLVEFIRSLGDEPPPVSASNPQSPAQLDQLVARLLAKQPEQRYESARQVGRELQALLGTSSDALSTEIAIPPRVKAPPPPGKRLWIPVLLGLPTVAGIALLIALGKTTPLDSPDAPLTVYMGSLPAPQVALDSDFCGATRRFLNRKLTEASSILVHRGSQQRPLAEPPESGQLSTEASTESDASLELKCGRDDGEIRVDALLFHGPTGYSLFDRAFYYRGNIENLESFQSEIAYQVVAALDVMRYVRRLQRSGDDPSQTVEALNRFYLGTSLLDEYTDPAKLDRAINALRQAAEFDQRFAQAHVALSEALFHSLRDDRSPEAKQEAEDAARRAFDLDRDLPEAKLALAQVHRRNRQFTEGIALLESLLAENPESDRANYELAWLYRNSGDMDTARRHYERAITSRPGYWRYYNALGTFLIRTGAYEEAKDAIDSALSFAPPNSRDTVLSNLSARFILEGQFEPAIELLENLPLQRLPSRGVANLGTAYFYSERWADAEACYREALSREPNEPTYLEALGDAQHRQGKLPAAGKSYALALELTDQRLVARPGSQLVRAMRACYLAKLGQCDEAKRIAEESLKEPSEIVRVTYLAKTFALCRADDRAIGAIKKLAELGASLAPLRREIELERLFDLPAMEGLGAQGPSSVPPSSSTHTGGSR